LFNVTIWAVEVVLTACAANESVLVDTDPAVCKPDPLNVTVCAPAPVGMESVPLAEFIAVGEKVRE
jgi:hypothetical protein